MVGRIRNALLVPCIALHYVAANEAYDALPTFEIPSFDYTTLYTQENSNRMLVELQKNGIISLHNVPGYTLARERYLEKAAECVVNAENYDNTFVKRKLFNDGTRRLTISTSAGRNLEQAAIETIEACPGYRELYQDFSRILENAVNSFGIALDATSYHVSDGEKGITSRKLVSEAVRLDHFHVYESARELTPAQASHRSRQLYMSLPMHEDHGYFISMVAPQFFDVSSNDKSLKVRRLESEASGLVIRTGAGEDVRPILKDNELIIMMGTGATRWLKTTHQISAVMHGMQMPDVSESNTRLLRAWFGKMTLLPTYQRMLNKAGIDFGMHSNLTRRYLLEDDDNLKTIGCASGRRLTPSEGDCVLKKCTLKEGAVEPKKGCDYECNHNTSEGKCEGSCTCEELPDPAQRCWMLCVAKLPEDQCAVADQTCKDQTTVCGNSSTDTTSSLNDMGDMEGMDEMGSSHEMDDTHAGSHDHESSGSASTSSENTDPDVGSMDSAAEDVGSENLAVQSQVSKSIVIFVMMVFVNYLQ